MSLKPLYLRHMPCTCWLTGGLACGATARQVELDAESLPAICEALEAAGLRVVGWRAPQNTQNQIHKTLNVYLTPAPIRVRWFAGQLPVPSPIEPQIQTPTPTLTHNP